MAPIPYSRLLPLRRPDVSPVPQPTAHALCQEEIDALCSNAGHLAVLQAQMKKRLDYWQQHPEEARSKKDWFEFVGNISEGGTVYPCYSLRFNKIRSLGNLRILYIMDGDQIILMHAFQERHDRAYRHAKAVVEERLRKG